MKGYINIHRMIVNHWVWRDSRLGHHWIDILLYAQWEDKKTVYFAGKHITLRRGQQVTSTRLLMLRWNTNPKMVLKTLKIFEEENMITCRRTTGMTLISVCNYDDYQSGIMEYSEGGPGGNSEGAAKTAGNRRRKQNKEDNKIKNTEIKQIVVDVDERQKLVLDDFLSEEKVRHGCGVFKISEEIYRSLVEEIVKEWRFTDEEDWSLDHLRNTMRKKVNLRNKKTKRNGKKTDEDERDRGRDGAGQNAGGDPFERATIRGSRKKADSPQ